MDLTRFRGPLPSRHVRGKESTLGRKHTHYATEFRAEAVRLAETSDQSIRQVALDLGISNQMLGEWMRLAHAPCWGTPLSAGAAPVSWNTESDRAEPQERA